MASLKAEHEWLVEHHSEAEKHSGRWIAILDGRIISDGKTFSQARRKAAGKQPEATPLILYVPKKNEELLVL